MNFKQGGYAYLLRSNSFIEEVQIVRIIKSTQEAVVRFSGTTAGTRVRLNRLYHSETEAQQAKDKIKLKQLNKRCRF